MRTLRDPLTPVLSGLGLWVAVVAQSIAATAPVHPYFPLAVGNEWTYRCSIEGEPRRSKVLQIKEQIRRGDTVYFRAELRVGADPKPLVQFLSVAADGSVRRSLAPEPAKEEVVIGPDTSRGTHHGTWTSAGIEPLRLPTRRQVQALKLENFSIDSPDVPFEKRNEWRARYYAKGIGPVAEADGLGGRCELSAYRLAKPASY